MATNIHTMPSFDCDAGVVAYDVEPAAELDSFFDQILDLAFVGYVAGDKDCAVFAVLGGDLGLNARRFDVGANDASATVRESNGCGLS